METKFNSHLNHNPDCDIVEGRLNVDTFIAFGIYIKDTDKNKKGDMFMELYTGENYNVGSNKKSYSRHWAHPNQPKKYFNQWLELKNKYIEKYLLV